MVDTYCPTCGEPWDTKEGNIVRVIRNTHRCPCCPKDMETDSNIEKKMRSMLFDMDCDDGDPFSFI